MFGNFHSCEPHHNLKDISVTMDSNLICYSERQDRFKAIAASAAAWGPIFRGAQKLVSQISFQTYIFILGPGVAQWLRHCATSRAVPGSNPGGVITGIFLVDTDRTMCPGVNSASKK